MKIVACIPARGGSKRISNKNIVDLNGQPLISYSIETFKKIWDEVWVSTDCPEIKRVAEQYGAKVLDRPSELCTDTASSEDALLHFAQNVEFDILVFMQCTSPLTTSEHLAWGVSKVFNGEFDSALSVCEDKRFYWNENGTPINYDLLNRPRTQNVKPVYKETGAFYITTREALLKSKCRISGKIGFVIVPEKYSFEIDDYDDLDIIKALMATQNFR